MNELKGSKLISTKDIQIITGYSIEVCRRDHRTVRDALGKKSKMLTVKEYCDYYELDYSEIVSYLNPYR
ncbi:hypothetical protein SAMN05216474_2145 [Lishizhenia tianjinensis]|jgi:hypothetical protein|uniref:Uncharacterized protein n=2 Tax=Flavobacteriales TaxID=200644 RepID=A0A1I7AJ62_9FLAO|nr:hypothetical protein [Parvicella tangerina]MCB9197570.1 hypothetical protein [Flavobacteriales bacterium]CAG5082796.1 hypothetical protein CRYO30217_02011 [Parvicella tangerina]SFT74976.1 hypothetical protein SAMN05216474_2145 [Lishizhenia tianjinensis]